MSGVTDFTLTAKRRRIDMWQIGPVLALNHGIAPHKQSAGRVSIPA
jgi:hypothetical protein